jgi:hypothetical protein
MQFHNRRYTNHDQWGMPLNPLQACIERSCAMWRTDRGLGWCGLASKPVGGTVVADVEPFDLYKLALLGGKLKLADGFEINAPEPPPEVLAKLIVALRGARES